MQLTFVQKESMENSLRMMNELNSVLAVRTVKKKQKRELKQRKKLGDQPLQGNNSPLPSNHLLAELQALSGPPVAEGVERKAAEKTIMADSEARTVLTPIGLEGKAAEKQDSEDGHDHSASLRAKLFNCPPPTSAMIAKAAAAAALKAGRTDNEELFYYDDLCIVDEKQE